MSDVWQGPGWWLAPDGKWYPEDGGPTESASNDAVRAAGASASLDSGQVLTRDRADLEPSPVESPPEAPAAEGGDTTASADVEESAIDDAAVASTGEAPKGGWTAVEPEVEAASEPSLTDDAQWAAEAETAEPTEAPPTAAEIVPPARQVAPTIERDEAWRKPGEAGTRSDVAEPAIAPAVVDVTEATEPLPEPEPVTPPSPWRGVLLALGFLAAIIGLSILLGLFFTNVVFDGDDEDASDASTTTAQSAPSTEAPATTEATTAPTTEDPAAGTEVSVFELETGDCIEGDIGTGPLERLIRVDCAVPHQFEVYTEDVLDPSITEFDEEVINAAAETICRDALDAYIPADDDRNIQFKWFQPTPESWTQEPEPDRTITCLLFDADGPMTGRAA